MSKTTTLGSLLRALIERLDHDVELRYQSHGLDYRPRYTPVVRALQELGPASITSIANHTGIPHSAVSQTVAQMHKKGWIAYSEGQDKRTRIVSPTAQLDAALPTLRREWEITRRAADALDAELSTSLSALLVEAHAALDRAPFSARGQDQTESPPIHARHRRKRGKRS
ncbi:MAG: MarR family transcriptional regulator [Proteobacteria bacterium]|nr:MarR family transcriptional regulator [Pseudomonadota bacterium]